MRGCSSEKSLVVASAEMYVKAVSSPDDPAVLQEEMALATLTPCDGRMQTNRTGEMTFGAPPREIILNEAKLNRRATATGTEQGGRPWN